MDKNSMHKNEAVVGATAIICITLFVLSSVYMFFHFRLAEKRLLIYSELRQMELKKTDAKPQNKPEHAHTQKKRLQ